MVKQIEDFKQEFAENFEFENWNELRRFFVNSNQEDSLDEIERDLIYTIIEEYNKMQNEEDYEEHKCEDFKEYDGSLLFCSVCGKKL